MNFTVDIDTPALMKGANTALKDNVTVSSITDIASDVATAVYSTQRELFGRDTEIATLRESLHRVCSPNREGPLPSSEIALVRGASGTGKSALVETLRSPVVSDYNGFFVSGKFDQMHRSDPFSALTACFTDLCDLIIQSDEIERYRSRIQLAIGAEIKTLESLIPNLYQVMGRSADANEEQQTNAAAQDKDRGKAFARFKHLCRSFLQAVAIPEHPIVLFLDDLQWADSGSTDILCRSLIRNVDSEYIFVVVAFRSDEESLGILNRNFFPAIAKKSKCLPISEIEVNNLDIESLNTMIMDMAGLHELGDVQSLGELVLAKTHGNAYFVRQFVESLKFKQLLVRDKTTGTYSWDVAHIKAETDISENVLQLVTAKIQLLSPALQQVLIVAAFLGFAFDVRVLQELFDSGSIFISNSVISDNDSVDVSDLLLEGVEEGMVEERGAHSNEFKFSHDRVQQALYAMVSNKVNRQQMHLSIGQIVRSLWEIECKHKAGPDTWKLFVACDQLNSGFGLLKTDEEKVDLLRLNLQTAKAAIEKTALLPAAEYLRVAQILIATEAIWKTDYDLGIDLFSTAAEVEYSLGNFDSSKGLVDIVLENASCRADAMRTNFTMLLSLSGQEKNDQALELAINLLNEMGEKFPKKPHTGNIFGALIRTKLQLFGQSNDDILNLRRVQSDEEKMKMRLLSLISQFAHVVVEEEILAVCILRMVTMTLKYGLSDSASLCFSLYGFLLSMLGVHDTAYRFSKLALALCEREQSPQFIARSLVYLCCFVTPYRDPVHVGLGRLTTAYQKGNASGETSFACVASCSYLAGSYFVGSYLPVLAREAKALCEEMEDLGQDSTYIIAVPFHQAILNLMGESIDSTMLTGDAMDDEEICSRCIQTGNNYALKSLYFVRLSMAAFYGEWDLALVANGMFEPVQKAVVVHHNGFMYMFLKGLAYFATWRDRKARVEARRSQKFLTRLLREGTAHLEPFVLFLSAEEERVKGSSTIREAYEKAIASAARHNLPHIAALANERAGLAMDNDAEYLTCAYDLCVEKWGAFGKAEKIKAILDQQSQS